MFPFYVIVNVKPPKQAQVTTFVCVYAGTLSNGLILADDPWRSLETAEPGSRNQRSNGEIWPVNGACWWKGWILCLEESPWPGLLAFFGMETCHSTLSSNNEGRRIAGRGRAASQSLTLLNTRSSPTPQLSSEAGQARNRMEAVGDGSCHG